MASFSEEVELSKEVNDLQLSTPEPAQQQPAEETAAGLHPAIAEDFQFFERFLPPAAILTLTREFATVLIIRTAYARVQLRIHYITNYPNEPPVVEISSPTLPLPLLRNKEKECMDKAREHVGKAQAQVIYEHMYKFIHGNMFIPCWKEMKQVATLCEGKGQLGVDEKEGFLQLRLKCGEYRLTVKIKVPHNYPEEGVQLDFQSANFPTDIQYMFSSQCEEIVRRCVAGFSPEQAVNVTTNPVQLPPGKVSNESKVKLTTESLKSIKHDVNVLKQMSDLRAASTSSDSRKYFTQQNAERREARKDLRRLVKAESEADEAERARLLAEEQDYMKELLKAKVSDVAQPSLYAVARFIVEDYVFRLPVEPCQACKRTVLPANPDSEAAKNPKSNNRAMRTFCGHWLHWNCLNEWLTTPPFVRQCPVCTRRIWHPDWPEDYKQLEKAWQSKEARKREVSDVSDFMGVGSEFITDSAKSGKF
eukprot:gene8258-9107_t